MSNEPKAGKGIDPEMLAAYIDNRLPPEQRAAVEARLATDPDSYALLVDTLEALEDDEIKALEVKDPSEQPIPFRKKGRLRTWMIAGGALAAAAAVVLAVVQPQLLTRYLGHDIDPRFEKLVAAIGEERYIAGRLTGGFKYGPLRPVTRGPSDLSQQNLALLAAAGELQRQASEHVTADNLHAWGVAQVLLGDYEAALETLQRVRSVDPDHRALIDLSAVYLALADHRPEALANGLAVAKEALEIFPYSPEAWFNLALVQARLGMASEAEHSLQQLEEVESLEQWSIEARRAVSLELRRPQAGNDQTPAREAFETSVLWQWTSASSSERKRLIATLAMNTSKTTQGAASFLAAVTTELAAISDDLGVSAIRELAEGMTYFYRDEGRIAAPRLQAATNVLCPGSPVLCSLALVNLVATNSAGDPLAVLETWTTLGGDLPSKLPLFEGLIAWRRGLASQRKGDFEVALAQYEEAHRAFREAGEWSNAVNMLSLSAEVMRTLGDLRSAWVFHLQAMPELARGLTPRVAHQVLAQSTLSCLAMRLPHCALSIQDEAYANAQRWGQASARAMVSVQRARAYARLADPRALESLAVAAADVADVPDPEFRGRVEAEVKATVVETLPMLDASTALRALDEAVETFETSGSRNRAAAMRLARGRSRLQLGDLRGARDDFHAGLAHLVTSYAQTSQGALRTFQANPIAGLLTGMADVELRNAQSDAALRFVLAARRSVAFGVPPEVTSDPPPIGRQSRNAECEVVFATDLTPAVVWVRNSVGTHLQHLATTAEALAGALDQYRRVSSGTSGRDELSLRRLFFDALVKPIRSELQGCERLTIVPDALTAGVPFSVLVDSDGQPLIASHILSIGIPAQPASIAKQTGSPKVSVIAMSNPEGMQALPGAIREANEIAALYRHSNVVIGPEATPSAVLAAVRDTDIVHVAAHAYARADSVAVSRLVLAPEPGSGKRHLYSDEIPVRSQSTAARVVVLAACSTAFAGMAATAAGEGVVGLAGAFLRGGVSTVVASTRDVNDGAAREFMVNLHRRLSRGDDVAAAVGETQREMLRMGGRASEIGSFQAYAPVQFG